MEEKAAETAPETRKRWRRKQGDQQSHASFWLSAVGPLAISLISLILSVYTFVESRREPVVWLSAPDVVRVATGEDAWFYVQPRLVSAAQNDRVAVIRGLRLEVLPPDGGAPVTFAWGEQGTWQYDSQSRNLTWIYQADPAPLVVGPSSPQLPICLFEGPSGWQWQAGSYQVTIVAAREQDADALQSTFTMSLPAETVDLITEQPRTWVGIRAETDPSSRSPGVADRDDRHAQNEHEQCAHVMRNPAVPPSPAHSDRGRDARIAACYATISLTPGPPGRAPADGLRLG